MSAIKSMGSTKSDSLAGEYFGTLLQSSVIAHQYHLETSSYAAHMALGSFYDAIPDLVDGLAESYQGCYSEPITGYKCVIEKTSGALEYLRLLKSYHLSTSGRLFNDPIKHRNLINEVDAITTLIDQTIYKLTFLH